MINRILIRIKVLQTIYSYYQNGSGDLQAVEKELLFSLRKSYDLYVYFLLLITSVTHQHQRTIETRKAKLVPTPEDLNPNMRLANNRFAAQIDLNESLLKYASDQSLSWASEIDFVRQTLNVILASELYADYLQNEEDSYEVDKAFWVAVFRDLICGNEEVEDYLENRSIYWNDDVEIIQTFVLKTLKKIEEKDGSAYIIFPMYKNMEDKEFAIQLLRKAIVNGASFRERIDRKIKNWETERVAMMDLQIMQMALAEIVSFPSIPIRVSLNEYIDLAKYYSTPKSGTFINGILDSVVSELKSEQILLKN